MNALTLPERAAVALGTAEHEMQLRLLVAESKTIAEIKNKDARTQCHAARMKLKNSRVAIDHAADDATEDAKEFTKAIKTEKDRLIALMSAEENRLQALQDKWDADREAERQAKIEAERNRIAAIRAAIARISSYPVDATGKGSLHIKRILEEQRITVIDDCFAEFRAEAEAVQAQGIEKLEALYAAAVAQDAEAARLQAEREDLARQRAEVAAKLAQQERDANIERERIAKEQAAAEAKLVAQRAEMARQQAERDAQAAAQAKAAREAQEAAQAKLDAERAELDRERAAMAEARRKQEADDAERVRLQALADQMLADHAEALEMNAAYLPAVDPVIDGRELSLDEQAAYEDEGAKRFAAHHPSIMKRFPEPAAPPESGTQPCPTDDEIIQVVAEHFAVEKSIAYGWLIEMQQSLEYL